MAKGHKKTDLQNLPACAAEFIRQVLRKMRYRRKVTQDVQAEFNGDFGYTCVISESNNEFCEGFKYLNVNFYIKKNLSHLPNTWATHQLEFL